jgi:hypothetical protein
MIFNLKIDVNLDQKVWMVGPDEDEEGFEIYETSVARIVIDQFTDEFESHYSQTQGSYIELTNGIVFSLNTAIDQDFFVNKLSGDYQLAFTLEDAQLILKAKNTIKALREDTAEMLEYKRLYEKYGDIFNK